MKDNINPSMTNEEKQLLFKDLCARAIYRPFVQLKCGAYNKPEIRWLTGVDYPDRVYIDADSDYYNIDDIKPYLRPMSSMTEEEREEYKALQGFYRYYDALGTHYRYYDTIKSIDYLYSIHVDLPERDMIGRGLALEAPDGMYKTE